jgi:hypothetical protein
MNPANLPTWALALLLFILLVVVPSTSHLLDRHTETDAAQAVAEDLKQAPSDARIAQKE